MGNRKRRALRAAAAASLTADEAKALAQLERKLQLVRDRTAAVVMKYASGFFLHGQGGVGKSFTVLEELRRLKANYKLSNSRMTGRGLFDLLERYPTAIHLLEDMESLLRDKAAQGVLRSALWSQGTEERVITWSTAKEDRSVFFTGGIIVTANLPLFDAPELQAVRTRIPCMEFQVTDQEMRALMRDVALRGYTGETGTLTPAQCLEVCDFVIEESSTLRRSLDMRLLSNGFRDYLQWASRNAGCHWKDLVAARLRERLTMFRGEVRIARADKKDREQQIAAEIRAATGDRGKRAQLWKERTGKSEKALYRRLSEVAAS